jgi:RNA polymerase sigma-70 factor (ECF subfamily)
MSSISSLRLLFSTASPSDAEGRSGRYRRESEHEPSFHESADPDVIALRAGDQAAFERFFRQHYAPLRRFAHIVMRSDDAVDVVEDLFAWLWESRDRLVIRGSLAAYLYSAVRHRALNVVRDRRKQLDLQSRFSSDIVDRMTGEVAAIPEEVGDDEEALLMAVRAVIALLPERRRLAITLRWDAGLGNREIAEVLGVAPQSVANLIQRALHDIRAALPTHFR